MTGAYGSHPGHGWDPKALPNIENINYRDMVAENVTYLRDSMGFRAIRLLEFAYQM